MNCRHCNASLTQPFLDLGFAPPSNAYLQLADLSYSEKYFPLKVMVCTDCWLVQTEDYTTADELFNSDYAYFSSTSSSWLAHSASYVEKLTKKLRLNKDSFVIEVACNDGYLLKNFVSSGIPCLGIEPTASTALVAEKIGVPVLREFFNHSLGKRLEAEGRQADLIIGNNVYAHVPDINNFTMGLKAALKPGGIITLEFPHLMNLIANNQFDTVYHEHFSYLSLHAVESIFRAVGLSIWNVEKLSTHGGSLRVYACHSDDKRARTQAVGDLLSEENQRGLKSIKTYKDFQVQANKVKDDLLSFLIEKKSLGQKVVGYGAAAKGNTLLNYAGVKSDLLPFIFDASSAKQGKYMPGSHIPILPVTELSKQTFDYILILPWNIATEIHNNLENLVAQHTKFVTAIPNLKIF